MWENDGGYLKVCNTSEFWLVKFHTWKDACGCTSKGSKPYFTVVRFHSIHKSLKKTNDKNHSPSGGMAYTRDLKSLTGAIWLRVRVSPWAQYGMLSTTG